MRDHPYQPDVISAGLWGVKLIKNRKLWKGLQKQMFDQGYNILNDRFIDQTLLKVES